MLFNKGESLQYPERVPFRLTQGIVDAMGVLGIKGPFKCCEIVLRVMTKEKKRLLSYLPPMVYDPLLKNNNEFKSTDRRQTVQKQSVSSPTPLPTSKTSKTDWKVSLASSKGLLSFHCRSKVM